MSRLYTVHGVTFATQHINKVTGRHWGSHNREIKARFPLPELTGRVTRQLG